MRLRLFKEIEIDLDDVIDFYINDNEKTLYTSQDVAKYYIDDEDFFIIEMKDNEAFYMCFNDEIMCKKTEVER